MSSAVAGLKELTMLEDCDAAVWLGDMLSRSWPNFSRQGASCARPARLDRVLTIGVTPEGSSVALLGTSRIPGTNSFPSDHYGIFAAVSLV